MLKLGWLIFALLLPVLLAPGPAAAQVTQQMQIILDASGSMWGRVNQEHKIHAAKRVLVDLVQDLKDRQDLELAIRVYGHQSHRDKQDCQDTKLELPFGRPDPGKVKALTQRIKAQGYTPLAYSLLQAKNDFGNPDLKRTIVLITDGLESCQGDPCQVARELAAAGLEVKLHVVGFDLKQKQLAKLQCLVEPSGGLLLGAGDAQQLKEALGEVVKQVLSQNLVVRVVDGAGEPVYAHVKVLNPADGQPVAQRRGKKLGFKLPAGTYDLLAIGPNEAQKEVAGITLTETELSEVTIELGLARLSVSGVEDSGQIAPLQVWVQRKLGTGDFKGVKSMRADEKPALFKLPAGEYRVQVQHRNTREKRLTEPFSLASGQDKEIKLSFGKATLTVSGQSPNGQPIPLRVWVQRKKADGRFQGVTTRDAGEKPASFALPPGDYRVEIRHRKTNEKRTGEVFSLDSGEQKELSFTFGKARLTVSGQSPSGQPAPIRVWVQRKKATGEYTGVTTRDGGEKPAVFDLPPGEYRLVVQHRKTRDKRTGEPFSLGDGEQKELSFTFGKASLSVSGQSPSGQPIPLRVWVQRKKATGDFTGVTSRDAGEKPAQFELPPGEYRLVVQHKKTRDKRTGEVFSLADGEQKEMSFTFGKGSVSVRGQSPTGEPAPLRVWVQRKKATGDYAGVTARNAGEKPALFELPPGEYRLQVQNKKTREKRTGEPFSLANGEQKEFSFTFEMAQLSVLGVDSAGTLQKVRMEVQRKTATGDYKYVHYMNSGEKPAIFHLPPDEYRIKAYNRSSKETRMMEGIILKHGDMVEKRIVFE